jgi:phosphoethanolamine N-methyltransferase
VQKHGASQVMGIDVEEQLVELARTRSRRLDLDDHLKYQQVEPGPLPFADASFDAVFSKDAIIHIREKKAFYAEMFRVLRPGGLLLVSDWLGAEGESVSPTMQEFIDRSGHDFTMVSLREMGETVQELGFVDLELEDRQAWYLREATQELERMRGPLNSELVELWGLEDVQGYVASWEILVAAVAEGSLRPGHIRAMKPEH